MNTLFEFTHNSFHTRGFAWAASTVPRSEMASHFCPHCGAGSRYPSGAFDVIVDKGAKYPDILGCGAYPFLIVSEAVVRAWREAGITSFHTYPVGIAEVRAPRLKSVIPPSYFRVEIDGTCRVDLAASGLRVVSLCAFCKHMITEPQVSKGFRLVPGSWDGSPLFRDANLYPSVSFCSSLILDLAGQHRFTNFRFEPMEGPFDAASRGRTYIGRQSRMDP